MRAILYLNILFQFCCVFSQSVYAEGAGSHKFYLRDISFEGATMLSKRAKGKFVAKYAQREVDSRDVSQIIREVTNHYISRGYITTSVSIPAQNLNSGLLKLRVSEGYIEGMEFPDKMPGFNSLAMQESSPLNLRDIEQSFDNLSLLKSNKPNIYIKPGNAKGSSIIVVENKAGRNWHLASAIDNNGSSSKGRIGSSSSLSVENILGLNEYYSFGYRFGVSNPNSRMVSSYTGIFALPLGYNFISCNYNKSLYKNRIKTEINEHISKGNSELISNSISRVIHRNGQSKTSISLAGGGERYKNYIDDYRISLSTYRVSKLTLGVEHQRRLAMSVISAGVKITRGINYYHQQYKAANFPDKKFSKINGNLFWHKPLTDNSRQEHSIAYNLQLMSQWTPHILTPTEKYNLSSQSAIRGYKDYVENVDNSVCWRNEMTLDITGWLPGNLAKTFGQVSSFVGFDYGLYRNYGDFSSKRGVLSGASGGIRSKAGLFVFDLTFARPLELSNLVSRAKTMAYFNFGIEV